MGRNRSIFRNVLCNWAGFATGLAVTFFLTPFVLHRLGEARYGIWTLTIAITGYYGLLDLGIRAGLTQYLTRYLAVRDFDRLNRTASSGLFVLLGCGVTLAVASLAVATFAKHLFTIPTALEHEVSACILIIGGSTAVQFVFFPFSAVLTAAERFDIANVIAIVTRLGTAVATVLALSAGYGLIGLSAVTAVGNMLDSAIRWRTAYRVLPQLQLSKDFVSWSHCREFLGYGFWNGISALSTRIISYSDAVVIGLIMPAASIARYALAVNLVNYFANMFVPVGHVFFPVATSLDAKGEVRQLQNLYLRATRLMLLFAISVGLVAAMWAPEFYNTWLGPEVLSGGFRSSTATIFQFLIVGAICTAGQRIGYQVLLGRRQVRTLAGLFGAEGVLNLSLSVILGMRLGILGVALGTTIPAMINQTIVIPAIVCRSLRIPAGRYLEACVRPLAVAAILCPGFLLLKMNYHVSGWGSLLSCGIIASLLSGVTSMVVGLNSGERSQYIGALAKRIRGRYSLGSAISAPSGDATL